MSGVTSFTAEPEYGPNGRRMLRVNGILYEWEEGNAKLNEVTEAFWTAVTEGAEEEEEECPHCGGVPCVLSCHEGIQLMDIAYQMRENNLPNKGTRFFLYRNFATVLYGHLGKGVRRELPKCVMEMIQDEFPAVVEDGDHYTGFVASKQEK